MSEQRIEINFQPFITSLEALGYSFEQAATAFRNAICAAFGIPDEIIFGYYRWERYEDEPFMEWSERLFNRGLLDDPDIRHEYQVELWHSLVQRIRRRHR